MESKEVKIGDKNYLINKERTFKEQCDFELSIDSVTGKYPRYEVLRADCRIEIMERDEKDNIIGKKFVKLTDENFNDMINEEGDELYLEMLKYKFPEVFEKLETKKKSKKKTSESNTSLLQPIPS